jgi:transposase, IS6 family
LRFGLSYRDIEALLAERGVEVDHVNVYAGGSGSPCCWRTPPGRVGIALGIAGRWTRPM